MPVPAVETWHTSAEPPAHDVCHRPVPHVTSHSQLAVLPAHGMQGYPSGPRHAAAGDSARARTPASMPVLLAACARSTH
eukprot:CAMPEP_0202919162 /NCGR_PEP_ID=MMETSP1392-20130828/75181_1 /ASSEMBLY_ACC=CAM_ASM_000868 /TAXON_ID=225041 /ORGANISM="Chlamydomonas chlamydogama, Strain SAG 11-48b" /LENGTH=78 /DNA_ID=CAMNT_0049612423 /DNA_START=165 /DNA_END=398 /DNA_ORIENTATION=-